VAGLRRISGRHQAEYAMTLTDTSVRSWVNDRAASPSVLAPAIDASQQRSVLPRRKSAWEPDTELFEQLRSVDVREIFESAARDRPYHA
jgi:hypothetical protein